jgi:major cell surface glycoprotein (TIGR04216 family)
MTETASIRRQSVALLTVLLMLGSVATIGVAAGPVAATVEGVETAPSAQDLSITAGEQQQDVSVSVQLANSSESEITIDVSDVTDRGGTVSVADVSVSGTDVSVVESGSVSSSSHTVTIADSGSNTAADIADVRATYTVDMSGVDTQDAGAASYAVSSANGQLDGSASFSVTFDPASAERSPVSSDDATKSVYSGSSVFQGESDLQFITASGETIDASALAKSGGDNEGELLSDPVDENASTGTYAQSAGSFEVTVQEPRISTAEVQFNGDDVSEVASGRAVPDDLQAVADWNFGQAEALEVSVFGPDDQDITGEVVSREDVTSSAGEASVGLDLSDESAGEYRVEFTGAGDLDSAQVTETYTFSLTSNDDVGIDMGSDSVTRGEDIEYTITGAVNEEYHLVTINSDEFRDGIDDAEQVFRDVGDTETVGFVDYEGRTSTDAGEEVVNATNAAAAFAIVQVDGTQASGEIDTKLLDDASVEVKTYTASGSGGYYTPANENISVVDDTDFEVTEGSVSINSPTGEYTIGDEVTVSGSVSSADAVRLYARDNGNWQPVTVDSQYVLDIDGSDEFEEEDIVLSEGEGTGNSIFSIEGAYELGVVADADVSPEVTFGSGSSGAIDTSEFSALTSERQRIEAVTGNLTTTVESYGGEVAEGDAGEVEVSGSASGQDTVLVLFIDDRGSVVGDPVDVSDGEFDSEEFDIRSLSQGQVTAYVVSASRDGSFGDGTELPSGDARSAEAIVDYVSEASGDGAQIRSRLLSVTAEEDGSDDIVRATELLYMDGRVSVDARDASEQSTRSEAVVGQGQPVQLTGETNRDPDNVAIRAELVDENGSEVSTTTVDEWNTSGAFSISLPTEGVEQGDYSVDVSTGDTSDRVSVTVGESSGGETEEEPDNSDESENATDSDQSLDSTEMDDEGTDDGASSEEDGSGDDTGSEDGNTTTEGDSGGQQSSSPTETSTEETDDSIPGFTGVTALISLVIVILGARMYTSSRK